MNKLDKQYTDLLQDILDNGIVKQDRTGTGTISVFGRQIRHDMKEGFPLLTTKKMAWKTMVVELLWFLRGDTNIKYLVENGCRIWTGDAKKNYDKHFSKYWTTGDNPPKFSNISDEEFEKRIMDDEEFGNKWGDLGPIYGKQWRKWGGELVTKRIKEEGKFPVSQNVMEGEIDQIQNLINDLKTNPDSRRLMVNAWNVGELDQMVLPPCHYGFQVYTRELSLNERGELFRKTYPDKSVDDFKPNGMEIQSMTYQLDTRYNNANIPKRAISLMWNQRSVDTFLGLPFNIASYGLLLEIIAKEVNMVPEELIGNLGDVHLYSNHIDAAKEQIGRALTFDERYKLYTGSDKTWEEGGGNAYGKINGLDMMDDAKIPTRTREPFLLPTLKIVGDEPSIIEKPQYWKHGDFVIENYQSHSLIKAPLSN